MRDFWGAIASIALILLVLQGFITLNAVTLPMGKTLHARTAIEEKEIFYRGQALAEGKAYKWLHDQDKELARAYVKNIRGVK